MNIQIIAPALKSDTLRAIVSNSNTQNKHPEAIRVFGSKGWVLETPSQNYWSRIFDCAAQEIIIFSFSMWLRGSPYSSLHLFVQNTF